MFCSKCIHSHVEFGQATCPICFTILDRKSFQLSKFVARQIGRLRIQCCYVDNGCLWQGLFSDNHISEVKKNIYILFVYYLHILKPICVVRV